jgi:hypothetical protein
MTEQASTEIKPKNAFIVRVKKGQSVALKENVIGIGWGKVQGMDKFAAEQLNRAQVKAHIRNAYENSGHRLSGGKLGNITGSIWKFSMEGKGGGSMSIDDYVLMPVGKGFHLGIVKSSVKRCKDELEEKADLKWQRDVEWRTKENGPILRNIAENTLQKRLKVRQTCVDVSKLIDAIDHSFQSYSRALKLRFLDYVKKNPTVDGVIEAFRFLNDQELEILIRDLCVFDGAINAKVLPKKNKAPGDADVSCEFHKSHLEQQNTDITYNLYQAKRHEGTSGHKGIYQIVERIKFESKNNKEKNYKGFFVTTAIKTTLKAQEMATENKIEIITRDKLIEWILRCYGNKI